MDTNRLDPVGQFAAVCRKDLEDAQD